MKTIITENERGLLFRNGVYLRMLKPGKYRFFGRGSRVVCCDLSRQFPSEAGQLDVFLRDDGLASALAVADVADCTVALHYVDGKFCECLTSGRYAYWKIFARHEFRMIDVSDPEVGADVPRWIFERIPASLFRRYEVGEHQKGLLFQDNRFIRLLERGTYYFWENGTQTEVRLADARLLQLELAGQELLTLDKVAVRINFVCRYRISDFVRVCTQIDDYREQLHVTMQLALREYVGRYRLDEILENRDGISEYVLARLRERQAALFVEIEDAGVKDIILPGEIRDIMNTVLVAEKRAQANVVTRREEVASTRSLLNTARLMDENRTLYKLKELEYLERICQNVGSITVDGGGSLMERLSAILSARRDEA